MTPAGAILAEEIARNGPVSFHRFMEVALYHPEHGYYRRPRDPFGRQGDFFTAEQLQPVFGILAGEYVRPLLEEAGGSTVVELGAGRREMSKAFPGAEYVPVDVDSGELPARFRGVVFANEFFDALPVHVFRRTRSGYVERLVGCEQGEFVGMDGPPAGEGFAASLGRAQEIVEVNLDALGWLDRLARHLEAGYLLAIDYGYTEREAVRFPQGTLMSYRRHMASDDVLRDPGERDITAHVNFTALERHAVARGFERVRFGTLAQMLLGAGERDQFAAALAAKSEAEAAQRRLQLKTLLYGMGETFRVLLLRKNENAPANRGAK